MSMQSSGGAFTLKSTGDPELDKKNQRNLERMVEEWVRQQAKKLKQLRGQLKFQGDEIRDRLKLLATFEHSADVKYEQIKAFMDKVLSAKDWDILGGAPENVLATLDEASKILDQYKKDLSAVEDELNQLYEQIKTAVSDDTPDPNLVELKALNEAIPAALTKVERIKDQNREVMASLMDATDRTWRGIGQYLLKMKNRTVAMMREAENMEAADNIVEAVNSTLTVLGEADPTLIGEKALAAIKISINSIKEAVKEYRIRKAQKAIKEDEGWGTLGPYAIMEMKATDMFRIVDLFFLQVLDLAIPKWGFIEPVVKPAVQSAINAPITKAKQLDKGQLPGFFDNWLEHIQEEFEYKSKSSLLKYLPQVAALKTLDTLVTAFADQVIARMPITPAQKHPGVELKQYRDELRSCYAAGLGLKPDKANRKLEALGPEEPWHD